MLMRSGNSEQKLKATAEKIQEILDKNGIVGAVSIVEGAADCTGIRILAEQPLPKSLGIRSEFDGIPVGFSIVQSLEALKRKPASPSF